MPRKRNKANASIKFDTKNFYNSLYACKTNLAKIGKQSAKNTSRRRTAKYTKLELETAKLYLADPKNKASLEKFFKKSGICKRTVYEDYVKGGLYGKPITLENATELIEGMIVEAETAEDNVNKEFDNYKKIDNAHPKPNIPQWTNGELWVTFINVGQGDCTAVITPEGKRILIDAGSEALEDSLMAEDPFRGLLTDKNKNELPVQRIKTVIDSNYFLNSGTTTDYGADMVILSHPDADHCNLIPSLLGEHKKIRVSYFSNNINSYSVQGIMEGAFNYKGFASEFITKNADTYNPVNLKWTKSLDKYILEKSVDGNTTLPNTGKPGLFNKEYVDKKIGTIVLYEEKTGFRISVLASSLTGVVESNAWITSETKLGEAGITSSTPVNRGSLVVCMEYTHNSTTYKIIVCGDATAITERFMTEQFCSGSDNIFKDTHILRMGHHGSKTSSSEEFLKKFDNLKCTVASAPREVSPSYRLPRKMVLDKYKNRVPANSEEEHTIYAFPKKGKAQEWEKDATLGLFTTGSNDTRHFIFPPRPSPPDNLSA